MNDETRPLQPTDPAPTTPPSGRHPVHVAHLVVGVAFLGLALVWALLQYDVVQDRDLRWLLPVPWVLAGAGGLVATAVATARRG